MQSLEERRRLLERYGGDEPAPLAAVLKCAAGILILVVVAAGPWVVLSAGTQGSTDGRPVYRASRAHSDSMAESRRVFEERRRLHEGGSMEHGFAQTLPMVRPGTGSGILRLARSTSC